MPHALKLVAATLGFAALGQVSFAELWELVLPVPQRGEIQQVATLANGDLLVSGELAKSSPHYADGWLARYSPAGEEVWSRTISEVQSRTFIHMMVTSDQVYVLGAHNDPYADFSGAGGFVLSLSLDGSMQWGTRLSETGAGILPASVQVLGSGDLLVLGSLLLAPEGLTDRMAYSARLTSEGKPIWSYRSQPGDPYFADVIPPKPAIFTLKEGERPEAPGPVIERRPGELDVFIRRLDFGFGPSPIGRCEVISAEGKRLSGADCENVDQVRTRDKSLAPFVAEIVIPAFVSPPPLKISKTGPAGDTLWTWKYAGPERAGLTDILPLEDGGLIGAGYVIRKDGADRMHVYDAILFRLDSSGREVWFHDFASDRRDVFAGLAALSPDEFYVVGHTGAGDAADWNPWIIRMGIDGVRPAPAE
ncbi:MAG: hypothetical protein C0421_03975 [Hyphomonas sp.]|nr:hypothetical protein [Hyphomonas sp.]